MSSQEHKTVCFAEVSKHNKPADAWVVVFERVYDITSFYAAHPGVRFPLYFFCYSCFLYSPYFFQMLSRERKSYFLGWGEYVFETIFICLPEIIFFISCRFLFSRMQVQHLQKSTTLRS